MSGRVACRGITIVGMGDADPTGEGPGLGRSPGGPNTRLLCVSPLRFHRRQLHALQPATGGVRRPWGGTRSLGLKRGALVKHPKWGLTYVGGTSGQRISLHSIETGQRVTQGARLGAFRLLAPYNGWRTHLLPLVAPIPPAPEDAGFLGAQR